MSDNKFGLGLCQPKTSEARKRASHIQWLRPALAPEPRGGNGYGSLRKDLRGSLDWVADMKGASKSFFVWLGPAECGGNQFGFLFQPRKYQVPLVACINASLLSFGPLAPFCRQSRRSVMGERETTDHFLTWGFWDLQNAQPPPPGPCRGEPRPIPQGPNGKQPVRVQKQSIDPEGAMVLGSLVPWRASDVEVSSKLTNYFVPPLRQKSTEWFDSPTLIPTRNGPKTGMIRQQAVWLRLHCHFVVCFYGISESCWLGNYCNPPPHTKKHGGFLFAHDAGAPCAARALKPRNHREQPICVVFLNGELAGGLPESKNQAHKMK